MVISVSWPFLSIGCPALALKNVLPVTEWKSMSVPVNGQNLKEQIRDKCHFREGSTEKELLGGTTFVPCCTCNYTWGYCTGERGQNTNAHVAGPVTVASKRETEQEQSHRKP